MDEYYNLLRYFVAPPAMLFFFTFSVQFLANVGAGGGLTWSFIGNLYSWSAVGVLLLYALLSLWVPSKTYLGPATRNGFTPKYQANGAQFFFTSIASFVFLLVIRPETSLEIYANFNHILASCNVVAIILCVYLLLQGKYAPQTGEKVTPKPLLYEFYRGMEVHPRVLGVDVKQLTNCRFGLLAWELLVVAFFVAGWQKNGFSSGHLVCALLQTIYLGKFYWWETGYFNTLDITLDRAGYYICWGCLVWVPAFYTFSSYYLVHHPSTVSDTTALFILFLGVVFTLLNYRADWEKEFFRDCNGICKLWGQPATYIEAVYETTEGTRRTKLLTSGCWGVARHLNYVFEILTALTWSLPGLGYGVWPFLYTIFLTILLVHRVFRDEEKCRDKYGAAWHLYCRAVPYRLLPGIF